METYLRDKTKNTKQRKRFFLSKKTGNVTFLTITSHRSILSLRLLGTVFLEST